MTSTEVASVVRSVTVYQGRAMISREASLTLKAGDHRIIFPDLSPYLDRDSLQLRGTGEAVLGECVFETEYFEEDVDDRRRVLEAERLGIADELEAIELRLARLSGEKAFIERIAALVTTPQPAAPGAQAPQSGIAQPGLDVKVWMGMTGFYRDKHIEIDGLKLTAERELREINTKLEAIDARIDELGSGGSRSRDLVKVSVRKEGDGELTLRLSYMVAGPSWRPVYTLRAASDSDKLMLEYDAYLSQATGEDWVGTELKLSTARVNVSGVVPELSPWRLSFYRPRPAPMRLEMSKRSAKVIAEADDYPEGAVASASAPMEYYGSDDVESEEASVEDSGASVVFTVAGGGTVSGDNKDTRVGLARREFPAEFLYQSVPKLAEFAYLTARFKNDAEFPLLPGAVNIFFDGSFVANSAFGLIMPGQESDVSLGVDEGIKVEYRFIKRFKKNEGLVNKKVSEQFEYQLRVTNNRARVARIKLSDQFPLTGDKELTVKPLAPLARDGQKELSIDDQNRISWTIELKPAEKRELPLSFLVEYPAERTVSGL
jgi:uncharacterized protein (TIGR02231 family)